MWYAHLMIIYIHHRTEVNGVSVAIGSTEVEVSILTSIVTDGLLPFTFICRDCPVRVIEIPLTFQGCRY